MNRDAQRQLDAICAEALDGAPHVYESVILGPVCDDCWANMPRENPGSVPGRMRDDMQQVTTRCGHFWQVPVKGFPLFRMGL